MNKLVQDRKTGEWYNPEVRFYERMSQPCIMAVFIRMRNK